MIFVIALNARSIWFSQLLPGTITGEGPLYKEEYMTLSSAIRANESVYLLNAQDNGEMVNALGYYLSPAMVGGKVTTRQNNSNSSDIGLGNLPDQVKDFEFLYVVHLNLNERMIIEKCFYGDTLKPGTLHKIEGFAENGDTILIHQVS